MNLGNIISNVQLTLDDAGVHFTDSGVSTIINDAQRIVALTTLCYEKDSGSRTLSDQSTANYTEVDIGADRVTLTDSTTVTVTDLEKGEECYVYRDLTAGYFSSDFEFQVDLKCTANAADGDMCACWAVTNTVDALVDIDTASGDFLCVRWREIGGTNYIQLIECNDGTTTTDSSLGVTVGTQYYLKIVRDESLGAFGTLYCYIYTDAAYSTLFDSLSITLTEKQDFRYLFWMNSYKAAVGSAAWDGVISNLKIISGVFPVWLPKVVPNQQFMPMPADCIVPIYVRDFVARTRVYPAKLNDLELNDTTWWATTGTNYKYYSMFNPSFRDGTTNGYSMLVYPKVDTARFRLEMVYAAIPVTMTASTTSTKLPKGEESILADYGKFIGLIRQHGRTERAIEFLKKFMAGIGRINELMKSRYPGGRDFEPEPIEQLLERSDDDYVIRRRERRGQRTGTRRRSR
jgi:hypothetical protein